jgi:hypothetical protein
MLLKSGEQLLQSIAITMDGQNPLTAEIIDREIVPIPEPKGFPLLQEEWPQQNTEVIGPDKIIDQVVDKAFATGPSSVLFLNPPPPSPAELEVLQVSWIGDVVDSGFTAKEKVELITRICFMGVEG